MGLGALSTLFGAPAAIGDLAYNYAKGSGSGSGNSQGSIVGYANGKPIYSNTAMTGVDTSGMGTKAQQQAAGTAEGNTAATSGGYTAPTKPAAASAGTAAAATPPTYGTESGPGLLQQWFDERATGTDPGYEYATGRGLKDLDSAYAARGMYDSGAATRADSDYLANMGSQREAQLDQLAGGASAERNQSLATMLGLGTGLASGQAGLGATYDTGAAGAMSGANNTALSLGGQDAMMQYMARQGLMQNGMGLLSLFAGA